MNRTFILTLQFYDQLADDSLCRRSSLATTDHFQHVVLSSGKVTTDSTQEHSEQIRIRKFLMVRRAIACGYLP